MDQLAGIQQDAQFLFRGLENEWYEVRSEWRDKVGDEFERHYWQDVETVVRDFDKSIEELGQAMDNMFALMRD